MSADLNSVAVVGRLTRDPEMRSRPSGDPVMSLRLAVNSRQRDDEGQWTDRGNFFDIAVFGRRAEALSGHLSKGARIGVDGRLSWREWAARDGTKRQTVEIIAADVVLLDGRAAAREETAGVDADSDATPF